MIFNFVKKLFDTNMLTCSQVHFHEYEYKYIKMYSTTSRNMSTSIPTM